MARRVTMFKSNDGTLFDSFEGATMHDEEQTARNAIIDVVNEHYFRGMSLDEVSEMIWDNRHDFNKIFQKLKVSR